MIRFSASVLPIATLVLAVGCGGTTSKGGLHQACRPDDTCDAGLECDPALGLCIEPAEDCGERECGPSPNFGADCGTCQGLRDVCTDAGQCVDDCAGRECGLSPNGGFGCGTCADARQMCTPQGQCVDAWEPRFDDFVAALQADLADSNSYGVSVAIMEGGQITFARAFGSKDPAGSQPLTPETLMQIGSTTKQMTAVALLRNVEAGQVGLDDSLEQVLPELEFALDPDWDDQLTPRILLTHQGAFYDWIPWDGPADDSELADTTYDTYAQDYFLMAPPGSFWNYSNPNFVFAGLISEVFDDRAWPDIMREDLFEPLGMDRTYLRKAEVIADGDYALSYGLGTDDLVFGIQGPVEMADMADPGWARPAGLVWTTPSQMMLWAAFLMDGDPDVLSDALRAEVTKAQVPLRIPTGDRHYGYGMFVHSGYLAADGAWYETPVWEHGGNTLSFSHFFYVLPEADFAIAICASGFGENFSASVDAAITTLANLPAPTPAPEVVFDPDQLDRHVGSYLDPYNVGRMTITRVGDLLRLDMPDLKNAGYDVSSDLIAVSSDYFVMTLNGQQLDLTFIPETPDGPSEWVRNRAFVTSRSGRAQGGGFQIDHERVDRMLERARLEPLPIHPMPGH